MANGQRPAYWYGDERVPLFSRVVSALYAGITGFRRKWYAKGWLHRRHPGVPVIVVGNISVGGTGKTPLTIALVERLRAEGWNPGIASRGYGRDDATQALWVEPGSDPGRTGDEPALMARYTGRSCGSTVTVRPPRRRWSKAAATSWFATTACSITRWRATSRSK